MTNSLKITVFFAIFLFANINLYVVGKGGEETGLEPLFWGLNFIYAIYGIILVEREIKSTKIESWPQVKGSITDVIEQRNITGKSVIEFEFSYNLNDIMYLGNKFSYSSAKADLGFLKMHPSFRSYEQTTMMIGKAARVYYNPKNKSEGYLVNSYPDDFYIRNIDRLSFFYAFSLTAQVYLSITSAI
jgi:hypothetical protein